MVTASFGGAAKAAETHKKRHTEELQACSAPSTTLVWFCGVCKGEYKEQTDVEENWIDCDNCNSWFHWECVDLVDEPLEFLCFKCM